MNYTVLVLGVWCIIQVAIAMWGLAKLNNNCNNMSLYTRLRVLLVISAVTATVFFSNLMCNIVCYEGHEETSLWIALFTVVSSIIIMITEIQINSDINDCADNTSTFKEVLLYAGIIPTIFPLAYGLWMLYTWFKDIKSRRASKSREVTAKRNLAKQQAIELQKTRQAQRDAESEILEQKIAAIKAAAAAKDAEKKKKEEEKKYKIADDARKAEGKYTAEELVAMQEEKGKQERIIKAQQEIEKLETEIQQKYHSGDTATIRELGTRLKSAKSELGAAKRGDAASSSRQFGQFWS